jgi:hypothetical protein
MVPHALFLLLLVALAHSFTPLSAPRQAVTALHMGWLDGVAKAFGNQDYKDQDLRVRASHILIKGDNDLEKIDELMGEILDRSRDQPDLLQPVFAEVARRESQCYSSAALGGDLGLFGKGKMVQEFDWILFPEDPARTPPPAGAMVGPVLTEFGCHVILVTQRDLNRDQVEEKLARKD